MLIEAVQNKIILSRNKQQIENNNINTEYGIIFPLWLHKLTVRNSETVP